MSKRTKAANDESRALDPDHPADAALAAWLSDTSISGGVEPADWYAVALDADHWFSLGHVRPDEAALLLCGFNPHKADALADALISTIDTTTDSTTDRTTPDHFKRAVRAFEDAQSAAPAVRRTLRDWVALADAKGLRRHRWIGEYLDASPASALSAAPTVRAVQRQVAHAETIVSALRREGFDPLLLPAAPKGRAWPAKEAARAALPGMSKSVFDKAWQSLRKDGRIRP